MKNLIDQLNELEEQILFMQNRLIQLSLFEDPELDPKSRCPRDFRNSVNFFTQPGSRLNARIKTQFHELYDRKKKKLVKTYNFMQGPSSSFTKLAAILSNNQFLYDF